MHALKYILKHGRFFAFHPALSGGARRLQALCRSAALLLCCSAAPLLCRSAAPLLCRSAALPLCRPAALPLCRSAAPLFCRPAAPLLCRPAALLFCRPAALLFCRPAALLFCCSAALLLCSSAPAMVINGGTEQANNRFAGGGTDFIGHPYDWSGVGKGTDGRRFGTMISPSYYLTASHYPVSADIRFYEDNTTEHPHVYTRVSGGAVEDPISGDDTDLYLGRLSSPIPAQDNITYYPFLLIINYQTGLLDLNAYLGLQFFMYAANSSDSNSFDNYVGTNRIDLVGYFLNNSGNQIPTFMDYFVYDSGIQYEATGQGGDSGGPSLIPVGGTLAMLGTHYLTATEPTATLDAFAPHYFTQIWDAMAADPDNINNERPGAIVIYTNIPEPAGGLLLLLGVALVFLKRR